jgi:hypothetical protein
MWYSTEIILAFTQPSIILRTKLLNYKTTELHIKEVLKSVISLDFFGSSWGLVHSQWFPASS